MNGMHKAKEKGVLIAHHQFASSCQNKGVLMPKQGSLHAKIGESSCQNKGVFIALEMCQTSLCPSSHDHAKFSHECAKLIRIVQNFLTLWTISHDYAKSSLSTTAK